MATTQIFAGAARAGRTSTGGLYRRPAGEGQWELVTKGLPERTDVQSITVHPQDQNLIYLGTRTGPYRSTDAGASWQRLPFPEDGGEVWSITVHPTRPRTLYLGAAPVAVFKSEDGGDSWRRLSASVPERVKMGFPCRIMRLAVDPSRPEEIYAAVEVGGAIRSLDGGETWSDCSADLVKLAERPHLKSQIQSDTDIEGMMDGHALCVSGAQAGTVFLAVRMGLFRSGNQGTTWEDMEVGRFSPLTYARDVHVSPHDPRELYACLSPAARSEAGALYRSPDLGQTWQRFDHGVAAKSTMMALALHGRDRNQVFCTSRFGQVFGTQDGGRSWSEYQLPAGVTDVYALACA